MDVPDEAVKKIRFRCPTPEFTRLTLKKHFLLRYSTFGVEVDVKCLSVVKMSDNYPPFVGHCVTNVSPYYWFTTRTNLLPLWQRTPPILNLTFVCHQYIL